MSVCCHVCPIGEDPLLNGLYGSAYLEGLQGNDPHTVQAVVTLKHWFAYNLESYHGTTRHNFDANVTAFDLQNTYWPAWRKAVQENGALGIMCRCLRTDTMVVYFQVHVCVHAQHNLYLILRTVVFQVRTTAEVQCVCVCSCVCVCVCVLV